MFVSDLKCLVTLRVIAAGFWKRENLKIVTHQIFGPWSITGTQWIIHKVMVRHFLGLADILDILRPSFLLLGTESLPTVWPCSVPRNGGVCQPDPSPPYGSTIKKEKTCFFCSPSPPFTSLPGTSGSGDFPHPPAFPDPPWYCHTAGASKEAGTNTLWSNNQIEVSKMGIVKPIY